MDEFERIAAIKRVLEWPPDPRVQVGIGDDAAVLRPLAAGCVASVDTAVEHRHFRFDFGPARLLGRRAAVAALSDLAAMGARPVAMLSSLLIPKKTVETQWLEVVQGIGDAAREYAAPVVGGNLSAAREFSITTTVIGAPSGTPLLRQGARPGDTLFCSGTVGAAALGLARCLREPAPDLEDPFVRAWLQPVAFIDMGLSLNGVATACIDVSDGLAQDLRHLCAASGTGALVDAGQLPLAEGFARAAAELGHDPVLLALTGGEDYVLLFTAPPGTPVPDAARQIGVMTEARAGIRIELAGKPVDLTAAGGGYRHFAPVEP